MASPVEDVLSVDERIALITRNLQEVIEADETMRSIVEKRPLKLYWGTATTGAPHIAYFVPMTKIADFLRAGCEVTILFADLHAYLDNLKSTEELLAHRTIYYEEIIKQMLLAIGVSIDRLKFVRGTSYQTSHKYTMDMYRLTTLITERNAKKAGTDVVKQSDSTCLSGLLYPLLQALDEQYLDCDAQFGGVDQRKIFMLAAKFLPAIGYKKRTHLMNPMVPGLTGDKMSASAKGSKIDLLDDEATIRTKLKAAKATEGIVEGNPILAFVKMVLFPVCQPQKEGFTVIRSEANGGNSTYGTYPELEAAYADKQVHPGDLKESAVQALNTLLAPIRKHFDTPEMKELVKCAYPATASASSASATNSKSGAVVVLREDEEDDGAKADPAVTVSVAASAASSVGSSSSAASAAAASATSAPGVAAGNKVGKGGGGGGGVQQAAPPGDVNAPKDIARFDLRVGRVLRCEPHPHAGKLYVLQVDVGTPSSSSSSSVDGAVQLKQVVSGLRPHLTVEQLQGRLVILLTNLKEASLIGVKSQAMILAATTQDGTKVELLMPPEHAHIGERVAFAGYPVDASLSELTRANEATIKTVVAHLCTDGEGVAKYKDVPFTTTAGVVRVQSLFNAHIK